MSSPKDVTVEVVWQNAEVSGEEFKGNWQGFSDDKGDVVVLYNNKGKPLIGLRIPIMEPL